MFFAFRCISYTNISIEVMCDLSFICGVALDVPVLYNEPLQKYKFDLRIFTIKIGELFCLRTRTKIEFV